MRTAVVAAVALNQTPLDWQGNLDNIRSALKACRQRGVQFACLPELAITGYGCEDMFHAPDVLERATNYLLDLRKETKGIVALVGLPLLYEHAVLNAVAVLADGELLGFVPKQNLARDGIHYETRWFKAWPAGRTVQYEVDGQVYPLGDLIFDCHGMQFGLEICEDAWVHPRSGTGLAARGVDVIFNPSASHFAFAKHEQRRRLVLEGSRSFCVGYVYANLLGNEAGRAIYDGDCMIADNGELVARAPRFSYQNWHLVVAKLDVDAIRLRSVKSGPTNVVVHQGDELVDVPCKFPTKKPKLDNPELPVWEAQTDRKRDRKYEEFTHAIALGLFDYMRKSYSRGFVVSLSGGADSSACAAAVWLMRHLAAAELGEQGFDNKLAYLHDTDMPALLLCAYQASDNSGSATTKAARVLAKALDAEWHHMRVADVIKRYTAKAEKVVGRELTWDQDDLALQNIQARARGPSIWMLANLRGALLVSTSNRSEAAVGYATMDGDTCGGISPLAGIDKAFLLTWLTWLEEHGPEAIGPVPGLSVVNGLQPTAELRPEEYAQTDEADLMPYPVLDFIERLAIRDKLPPARVYDKVMDNFDTTAELALEWVERFFRLWSINQWKRERYAPSFHYDDANLDPKTWCRFPILSGGFRVELAELRARVVGG